MRKLWGRLLCRWKGKHVERRVAFTNGPPNDSAPYNRVCKRCGALRYASQRKKAAA